MSYSIDYTVSGNRASSSYSASGSFYSQPYSILENRVQYADSASKQYSSQTQSQVVVEAPKTIIYDKSQGYSNKIKDKFTKR